MSSTNSSKSQYSYYCKNAPVPYGFFYCNKKCTYFHQVRIKTLLIDSAISPKEILPFPYCIKERPIPFLLNSLEINNISSFCPDIPIKPLGFPSLLSAIIKTGTAVNACGTYALIFWISSIVKNKCVASTELCHIAKSCSNKAGLRPCTSAIFIVIRSSYPIYIPIMMDSFGKLIFFIRLDIPC